MAEERSEAFSEDDFACLQDAVTIAKERQIGMITRLHEALLQRGWDSETIRRALTFWGRYEQGKGTGSAAT